MRTLPFRAIPGLLAIFVALSAAAAHAAGSGPSLARLLQFDAVTQIAWGERYEHGEGVKQDYDRAVKLYCAAARRGNAKAQYRLGWMYANGRGVARDDGLAAAWFSLAADKGDEQSRRMLDHLVKPKRPVAARCIGAGRVGVEPFLARANSPERKAVAQAVHRLADRFALDPNLVFAVIEAESGFNPKAVSPKGAMGVMQLMPGTADRFGVRDPFDVEDNLKGGMAYLRWLLGQFDGSVPLALAAYNAGEEAVARYGGIPPYPETQTYVRRITLTYPHLRHPVSGPARPGQRGASEQNS